MLNLPVTSGTFRRGFLDGRGELAVALPPGVAGALRADEPLPEDVPFIACAAVTASPPALTFGGGAFRCTATFSGSADSGIEVLRPGQRADTVLAYAPEYAVPEGQIALRLFLRAAAEVDGSSPVPAVPGLSIGVNAGGHVGYSRIVLLPQATPARAAVLDLLSDLRLPQGRGRPADAPAPGELVMFEYGGFLGLRAGLTWGYSLSATESLDPDGLEAAFDYAVRLKGDLSLGYRMAGSFLVAVRAGERPGWVRLSVHKSRESDFSFAAGFVADADTRVEFTREVVDDALLAFLGADARRAVAVFDEVRSLTTIDAVEKRVGKLLMGTLEGLSHRWVGRALDETALGEVVTGIGKAVDAYRQIDARVLDLYEDYVKRARLDALVPALQQIVALDGKAAIALIPDEEVRAVVQRLGGEALFTIVERNATFAEVQGLARSALGFLDGSRLKDLIDQLQQDLRLDDLFGRLEQLSSKEDLLALADRRLQGVVERIVGRAFEEIRASDAGRAFAEVRRTLDRIEAFRAELTARLEKALVRSVSMEVNYAFARSATDKALVDLEFDVRTPRGAELFDLAAGGQIANALAGADLPVVRVHQAVLTHQLRRSAQLQVNFVGWTLGRLVELVSDTALTMEEHEGGLVQLFTTAASIKQRRESGRAGREVSQTVFLFRLAGEVDRAPESDAHRRRLQYLVKTLNHMSAASEALFMDEQTTLAEMYEYLALARWLELIPPSDDDPRMLPMIPAPGTVPSVDRFIRSLESEFPGGLGKVTAQYVVRYDDDALRDAFTACSGRDLERRVSESSRRLIGGHLMTPRQPPLLAAQGVAFTDGDLRRAFEAEGPNAVGGRSWTVTLPPWLGSRLANRQIRLEANRESATLASAFLLEQALCRALRRLDTLVDDARDQKRSVPLHELSRATTDVLRAGAGLDRFFGVNVLFGVMDDLVQQGRQGKGRRQSSLILEIEPPAGGKVTKYLMAGGM